MRRTQMKARQQTILDEVELRGFATVDELAAKLQVTTQTIRRDIDALAAGGQLSRYHGGAGLPVNVDRADYRERAVRRVEGKQRIADRVTALIPNGSSVFLDAGTTAETIATGLTRRMDLRVVTYNIRVANILTDNAQFAVAIPGGFVRTADGSLYGDDAVAFVRNFRFDYAVIAVSGIDEQGILMDDDYHEVQLVRTAMARAEQVILATDGSKFDHRAMVCLGSLEQIAIMVTDEQPPPKLVQSIEAAGVQLHVV